MAKQECKKCKRKFRTLAKGFCANCNPKTYYKYYDHLTEDK